MKSTDTHMIRTESPQGLNILKSCLVLVGMMLVMLVVASTCAYIIQHFLPGNTRTSLLWISAEQSVLLFAVPAFITAIMAVHRSFPSFLGLNRSTTASGVLFALAAYVVGMPALNQIILYNAEMPIPWPALETAMKEMEAAAARTTEIILDTSSVGGLISGILIIGVLTGFCEEVLFRGALQSILYRNGVNGHIAVWVSAAIFSAAHFQFYGFLPRLLLGAFFGYLLLWSGSLWLPVICHAVNNSVVVCVTWLTHRGYAIAQVDTIGTSSGVPYAAIISAVAVVLILVYGHRALWPNKKL